MYLTQWYTPVLLTPCSRGREMGALWSYCCGADNDSDQGESGERTRLIRWVVWGERTRLIRWVVWVERTRLIRWVVG